MPARCRRRPWGLAWLWRRPSPAMGHARARAAAASPRKRRFDRWLGAVAWPMGGSAPSVEHLHVRPGGPGIAARTLAPCGNGVGRRHAMPAVHRSRSVSSAPPLRTPALTVVLVRRTLCGATPSSTVCCFGFENCPRWHHPLVCDERLTPGALGRDIGPLFWCLAASASQWRPLSLTQRQHSALPYDATRPHPFRLCARVSLVDVVP